MGTTREDVINVALDALGEPRSVGTDDDSTWVVRLRNAYEARVRFLLEDYAWNFATDCEQMTASEPTPDDWLYGFNKPASWMRTLHVSNCADPESPRLPHDDRQGRILADQAEVWHWWIDNRWITLEGSWPQHFADTVSMHIAYAVMPATSENEGRRERVMKDRDKITAKAKTWDAQQKPAREQTPGKWAMARRSGLGRAGYRG